MEVLTGVERGPYPHRVCAFIGEAAIACILRAQVLRG